MPTLRSVSGLMATEWFGRPESAGHEIVREGQARGIFGKGKGGGFGGSPNATTREGVLVFLALQTGSGPKHALSEALSLFELPHDGSIIQSTIPNADGSGVTPTVESVASPMVNFGHHLSWAIHAHRARLVSGEVPFFRQITYGINSGKWYVNAFSPDHPLLDGRAGVYTRLDHYEEDLAKLLERNPDFRLPAMGRFVNEITIGLDGSVVKEIAWALGHFGDDKEEDDIGGPLFSDVLPAGR